MCVGVCVSVCLYMYLEKSDLDVNFLTYEIE